MVMTELAYTILRKSLDGFMKSRCQVSSQHKLPGIEELLDTITVHHLKDFYGITDDNVREVVEMNIANGLWFRYGPYLSDHPIDVM